jgi:hypothetical protein
MEYIVVLVTSYFCCLASAPKVLWQAGARSPVNTYKSIAELMH